MPEPAIAARLRLRTALKLEMDLLLAALALAAILTQTLARATSRTESFAPGGAPRFAAAAGAIGAASGHFVLGPRERQVRSWLIVPGSPQS